MEESKHIKRVETTGQNKFPVLEDMRGGGTKTQVEEEPGREERRFIAESGVEEGRRKQTETLWDVGVVFGVAKACIIFNIPDSLSK